MRFLSIAERELRAGARHKVTHRMRWITAAGFIALLAWLMWAFDNFRAPQIFHAFATITLFYCLIFGTAQTADCLSSEKREGTMGLLFLTNLNGPEIIGGKLCSSALAAAYGLFAIFPLLALQMLIGGITLGSFWRTVLALADAVFFSVAAGFLASSICLRQFTAVATATGLALFFSGGLMAVAAALDALLGTRVPHTWVGILAMFSPLYTLISADSARIFGRSHFWWSIIAVTGLSLMWLTLATWRVSRSWRDRPAGARFAINTKLWERWRARGHAGGAALRRRLLDINPFYWLGSRTRVSAPVFMIVSVAIVACTSYIAAPYFGRVLRAGTFSAMVGQLFAWLWAGLLIHALVLYYAAMVSSRRLAEDKQTGALELVLSTPTSERSISRGLWLAYGRRMFFPALIAVLVHFFFIWQGATMLMLDGPRSLPSGTTPWELIWNVLLGRPIRGVRVEWGFTLALRLLLLVLVLCILVWITLGWLGRWLGLRMKHPGFAPMVSLALLVVPPVVLFSLACYCVDKLGLDRLPERILIPMMVWVAFGIGVGHCVMLSLWSSGRLRREFRAVVTSRFQPKPVRNWWRPNWQRMRRQAVGGLAFAGAVAIIIGCFYGYQNWRSRRTWSAFQNQLKQRKQSLDVTALLPGPLPEAQNFARSAAFQKWAHPRGSHGTTGIFDKLNRFDTSLSAAANVTKSMEWTTQLFAPLEECAAWIAPSVTLPVNSSSERVANIVLEGLKPHDETIRELAAAARLPYFQTVTNRAGAVVLNLGAQENAALERLHMLFQIRACALLTLNRNTEAAEDLLTGLQLGRLSRQIPDARSSMRTQILIVRSLQPLWEGIVEHRWTEPQLAAFQKELGQFNLLSDYTNAVRRAVLATIEAWRSIADGKNAGNSYLSSEIPQVWQVQPRSWWLDNCVQLYEAGQMAIGNVDVAGMHVRSSSDWADLDGLRLDYHISSLLQQPSWRGASAENVTFAQTAVNQAITACAIERFRSANGSYPKTLQELAPKYLATIPKDVVRGLPLLYENTGDGRFTIRGVGLNGKADLKMPGSDDWLWSFPTNAPSTVLR